MKTNCVPVQQPGYYVRPNFERQEAEAGPYARVEDLYQAYDRGDFHKPPGPIPVARWKAAPDPLDLVMASTWENQASQSCNQKSSRLAEAVKIGKVGKWACGSVALAAGLAFCLSGSPQALGMTLATSALSWGYFRLEKNFEQRLEASLERLESHPSLQRAAQLRQPHWDRIQMLEHGVRLQPPGR